MSDEVLTTSLTRVSKLEREVIADVVEHIREFMERKLFLDHGSTTMFSYLVEELAYAKSTAQNRIDAARLLMAVPELQNQLATGELNLTHVTVLSQAIRQYEKEKPHLELQASDKKRLLEKMKGRDTHQAAVIVAQDLDLDLKMAERARAQKDESIRLEITLSKEQMAKLKRVRDLSSHKNHNPSWAEVIVLTSEFYIAKKDPTIERTAVKNKTGNSSVEKSDKAKLQTDDKVAAATGEKTTAKHCDKNDAAQGSAPNRKRAAIPVQTRRAVFRRDHVCQWIHPETGEICGETFQLQIDHVKPVHQGGGNESENLQVLCGVHNRLKYRGGITPDIAGIGDIH